MSHYRLTQAAFRDLRDAHDYIALDSAKRAVAWPDSMEQQCQRLAEFPGLGRRRAELADEIRSYPVSAYVIFYRAVPDGVEITRVIHGARDLGGLFPGTAD